MKTYKFRTGAITTYRNGASKKMDAFALGGGLDLIFRPSPGDDPIENSKALQALTDSVSSAGGGSIYIPAGAYRFGSTGQARGIDYAIRMRSNVSVYGDGSATVLLPVGQTQKGLDMFYFNDYREKNQANYLENCRFADLVIDAAGTSCRTYSTGGKGFMLNLIRNCHWRNVTVLNTDATGIGVDCPINCTIDGCRADGCGKGADQLLGASGIGIGYGYSNLEGIRITRCTADHNKNFGIFTEHQGRFSPDLYPATSNLGFLVQGCSASENHANIGGDHATSLLISGCQSALAYSVGYLLRNCQLCHIDGCDSNSDRNDGVAVAATGDNAPENKDISVTGCMIKNTRHGIDVYHPDTCPALMQRINIGGNSMYACSEFSLSAVGQVNHLTCMGNASDSGMDKVRFTPTGTGNLSSGNSWDAKA